LGKACKAGAFIGALRRGLSPALGGRYSDRTDYADFVVTMADSESECYNQVNELEQGWFELT
jgi:hypothetical protein